MKMEKTLAARYEIAKEKVLFFDETGKQIEGDVEYRGSLDLGSLTSIPEGFNPTVGGYLYLGSLTSIPEGFNPTVGGYLYLGSLTSIPEGFNPTVGGSLSLGSLTSIPEGFNPTVGGYLYLGSLTSIPEGFNPTVGGSLDLGSLTSIPEGFNPTVGGSLDLGSLTSIPEGFNPTVGGYLDLGSLTSAEKAKVKVNKNVDGLRLKISLNIEARFNLRGFSIADGILGRILSKKTGVLKIEKVGKKETLSVVSDGNGNFSHGETIKQARED